MHGWIAIAVLTCGACAPTTGGSASSTSPPAGELYDRGAAVASISGTTVDAKSGEALAGVEITGPGEVKTRSDTRGRFVLAGLAPGTSGVVEAHTADGRRASVTLRPLGEGRLEIVLHLR